MTWAAEYRTFAAISFGAAGVVSIASTALIVGLLSSEEGVGATAYAWNLMVDEARTAWLFLAAAGISGGVGGAWWGDRLGKPASEKSGALNPDVSRGIGITLVAFVVGSALFALAAWLLGAVESGDLREAVRLTPIVPFYALEALVVGAISVLPIALVFGGLTGWLVGRFVRGTVRSPTR